jgi:hypothetical protein
MRNKSSLLGGAAVGLVLAMSWGAAAQAKPVKHHHHVAAAPKPDPRDEEIQELKSENASLNSRLTAVEANQAQTQAAVQQAQATAQQAAAAQAANADQIKRIPGEVETTVSAKIPKPVTGWWNNTTVSGTAFADISNIDAKYDGVKPNGSPNGVNFDIKRFYLIVDHKFNNVFSANLTTDFNYDSGPAGATQLYLKKAYLQAKLADALIVRAGSADLPWVPFVEGLYGYRYVENVVVDRDKFGTSADWGIHVLGTIPLGEMKVSYAGSVINGMGYKKPGFIGGVNRSNNMDFEGRLSAQFGGFTAAVGGYDGKLGKAVQGVTTYNTATRFDALLAYSNKWFKLGGEYMLAHDWNDVTLAPPGIPNRSEAWSIFGNVNLGKEVSLFGRYDWVKPKDTTATTLRDQFYNFGIQYEPVKTVDLSLVYKRNSIDNGAWANQDFATVAGVVHGTYDEIGMYMQYKW